MNRVLDNQSLHEAGRFAPISNLLETAVANKVFPGAAWGVLQHGTVRALGAVGGLTYEPESPRVQPGSCYDLASLTKVVATTAMAMLLYEQGLLDLDLSLGDLLPGFVVAGERGSGRHRVTLRLLLAHASGLPAYAPLFLEHPDATSLLRACLHLPLTAQPGVRAEYSDVGFILLGKALAVIAGEPLDRFCARELFSPLGMASTCFCPLVKARAAIPPTELDELFRRRRIQGEVHDENCFVLGGCAGHAGLFAPVADLLRFAEAILEPLRPSPSAAWAAKSTAQARDSFFAPATVRLFATRAGLPEGSSRALGWDTPSGALSSSGHYLSDRSIGHLGYTGTSLWLDPELDLAAVLLTNRTWPTRENKQIQELRPVFHDLVLELL